jgi:hypothetical protein
MSRHRSSLVLFLCLAMGSPIWASPGTRKEAPQAPVRVQATALSSPLDRLWQHLTALWGKAGCGIDPSGKPLCAPAPTDHAAVTPPAPEGCGIDPSGLCSR